MGVWGNLKLKCLTLVDSEGRNEFSGFTMILCIIYFSAFLFVCLTQLGAVKIW